MATSTGPAALGSRWRPRSAAPARRWRARPRRTRASQRQISARTTRAVSIQPTQPTSTISRPTDGERTAPAIIRSSRRGTASIASVSAHEHRVHRAADRPAVPPTITPMPPATAAASSPTASDTRAPCSTRANRSRPSSSVPNQCSADGAARRLARSRSSGAMARHQRRRGGAARRAAPGRAPRSCRARHAVTRGSSHG